MGANCTIVGGIIIGSYSFVGAGAVVNRNIPDYALFVGNPAKQIGWMSRYGAQLGLHTGEHYKLENGKVTLCK